MLTLSNPEKFNLLGISTVFGNNYIDITYENLKKVLYLSNSTNVKIVKGATKPLYRDLHICTEFHGNSGLGNADIKLPEDKN